MRRRTMLGHQVPDGVQPGRPARAPSPREQERELLAEMLAELRQVRETSSASAAAARSALNGVLSVETLAIGSNGVTSRQYRTMVGSVVVSNVGTADVTVSSAPEGASAASTGQGQYLVHKATSVSVPIGSHTVTLYGTAGELVCLQVYTGLVAPMSGPC